MNNVFHQWKVIVWQATSSLARKLASHLFIFKMSERFVDVGFSWQFYCRTRKQSHIRKDTTRCKTFANLFSNKNELRKVEEIPALELNEYIWHLRVYHFAQNQRRERLWAFSALKSIGRFWTTSKKEQLLCQYHEWPRIWENKKGPLVQTERVKEDRKRKQAKRFDSSDSGGQWRWVKTLLWYEYVVIYH